jgi:predicted DCC family thiol-disulfide oxidoreductase YuxK
VIDRIVFYDGECPLCGGFVQWIAARDRGRRFLFAPLQGETARRHGILLPAARSEWSLAFLVGGNAYVRSDAVVRAISELGGAWRLTMVSLLVPRLIRDAIYRLVARNRPQQTCLVPSPELERRLLP